MRAPLTLRSALRCLAVGAVAAACAGDKAEQVKSAAPNVPTKLGEIAGLKTPESARYDAAHDVWFISNINGVPSDKDGNGFISRARGDRTLVDTAFIKGGANGVTLNAPKGLAITGDTVWVADIDAVRGFDVNSGALLATIDLKPFGAVFLNDIAVGPDGALYVTDTGIRITASGTTHPGPDRVFRATVRHAEEVLTFKHAEGPNGITFDAKRGAFLIVPFASPSLFQWRLGSAAADSLGAGPGGYDGVEVLADGRTLVSSWTDSTVHMFDGGTHAMFIRGVPGPADFGVDTRRNVVAIPIFEGGRVEFWSIPPR